MTLANAKSVNRQTLENVVRNAASEFTRRTAIASLASLWMDLNWVGHGAPSKSTESRPSRTKKALQDSELSLQVSRDMKSIAAGPLRARAGK